MHGICKRCSPLRELLLHVPFLQLLSDQLLGMLLGGSCVVQSLGLDLAAGSQPAKPDGASQPLTVTSQNFADVSPTNSK